MRRVKVEVFCSPHFEEEDKEVPGSGVVYAIGWTAAREVDLCDHCRATATFDTLAVWLDKYGEIPEESKDPVRELMCPIDPGHNKGKPFANIQGRNNHLSRAHGVNASDYFASQAKAS